MRGDPLRLGAMTVYAVLLISAGSLSMCSLATAATHLVVPNGSGDYETIQAALDAVTGGDTIELAAGTFQGDGNRDIDFGGKAVTVRSVSGDPADVTIDCGGDEFESHRAFIFNSGEGSSSVLQDVTVTNGYVAGNGGAIYCSSASPTINGCVFGSNTVDGGGSDYKGGAIYCTGTSTPTITGCLFIGNNAGGNSSGMGGAIACYSGVSITVSDCHIEGNYADYRGGGVYFDRSDATLTDCTVRDNEAGGGAGIYVRSGVFVLTGCSVLWNEVPGSGAGGGLRVDYGSPVEITGCTFMGNRAASAGGMWLASPDPVISRTIVAYSLAGGGIWYTYEPLREASITCCNVFDNVGGNYGGQVSDQTGINDNISQEPQFCDAPSGDLTLYNTSPCAPDNSSCGQLIGAEDVDCFTAVEPSSWGRIKATFE